jgi:ABC-type sugar transport system ATPase subunit
MTAITKRFGGVHALEDVSFESHAGQVHALCGENGAGKSTLMKILAGVITDFDGKLAVDGQERRFQSTRDAEAAGIRIIHQELNLVPDLSVAGNIFLGEEITGRFGVLNERAMNARADEVLRRLGARIDPRVRVRDLRIGDQQMVEIAKAIAFRADVVIMDEPTSALSDAEVARLFRVIGDLKARDHAVIYISHKMNEVFRLADHVTVLRDGRLVSSVPATEASPARVVQWMVGRALSGDQARKNPNIDDQKTPVLEIRDLSVPRERGSGRPSLENVRLNVHAGEIVGVAGLLGAGRTELLETIFGAGDRHDWSGEIRLKGDPVRFRRPDEAIAAGLAMVAEDRKNLGLFADMNVGENITLTRLGEPPLSLAGFVRPSQESKAAIAEIARLRIKTPSRRAMILSLSGGNQQKAILGRWLLTEPDLLLLDEPTRGIDVGAKAEIHALLRELANAGLSVLVTSSELPELFAVADRIVVMCEGRVTDEMPREEATEERIMAAATAFADKGMATESVF